MLFFRVLKKFCIKKMFLKSKVFEKYGQVSNTFLQCQNEINRLLSLVAEKDNYTQIHSKKVARYSVAFAKSLNLKDEDIEKIKIAALLHDVGKIDIPDRILKKNSKLTEEEKSIMQKHTQYAAKHIKQSNPFLKEISTIVQCHHEHWDGSGYPRKLKKEEIPFEARIIAITDTYHALSGRIYKEGISQKEACEVLQKGAGSQWDADLVEKFIKFIPQYENDFKKNQVLIPIFDIITN